MSELPIILLQTSRGFPRVHQSCLVLLSPCFLLFFNGVPARITFAWSSVEPPVATLPKALPTSLELIFLLPSRTSVSVCFCRRRSDNRYPRGVFTPRRTSEPPRSTVILFYYLQLLLLLIHSLISKSGADNSPTLPKNYANSNLTIWRRYNVG